MSHILPKKEWHVKNKRNRQKVLKDELDATIIQEKAERKVITADNEARMDILRQRAGIKPKKEHLNLFKENNEELTKSEKEKIENDKFEKSLDIKFGRNAKQAPWYKSESSLLSSEPNTKTLFDDPILAFMKPKEEGKDPYKIYDTRNHKKARKSKREKRNN